ncbi:MAG: hypothetical protein KatS3mg057_2459 [Herpetosiphonaceae bacterium]|nr:MAG: hypothetical protein KatS3mg057_2459 [Herpetosiphonaceae bacterium]
MIELSRILLGLGLSLLIGAIAYRRGSLTAGGWLGAVIIGTATFGLGGWAWGFQVIVFFTLSSALSHYREGLKERLAGEKFAKGNRRDLWQALANGGASAGLAVLYALEPSALLFAAGMGALATAAADTWATELGVLSRSAPRLVTTGRRVEPGTSGAISSLGTLAAAGGGLALGLAALAFTSAGFGASVEPRWWMIPAGLLAGLAGALFDSLLGATVQSIRYCPHCARETERMVHTCGTSTIALRGWRWLDNDAVNFLSTLVGATVALCVGVLAGA